MKPLNDNDDSWGDENLDQLLAEDERPRPQKPHPGSVAAIVPDESPAEGYDEALIERVR